MRFLDYLKSRKQQKWEFQMLDEARASRISDLQGIYSSFRQAQGNATVTYNFKGWVTARMRGCGREELCR
ncbi:hypothetical protein MRB53_001350 [Persea americana]|uniref:Uncharacterized protein n=1 Tax=Persea americana TaxID=3435 RepID=A0ACC2MRE1_PERAE|nr:hypothetical protein MRB53_001350 [Persea americana]